MIKYVLIILHFEFNCGAEALRHQIDLADEGGGSPQAQIELLVVCEMSNVKCSQKIKVAVIPMSNQMSIVKIETIPNCQD